MKDDIKIALLVIIAACAVTATTVLVMQLRAGDDGAIKIMPLRKQSDIPKELQEAMQTKIVDTSIPKTSIAFTESSFTFGTVKEGDILRHKIFFTNTGNNPLVIYNVHSNCGCTIPEWTQHPITPGDTGHVTLNYRTMGEHGLQNKQVYMYCNTKPMESDIKFTANIK